MKCVLIATLVALKLVNLGFLELSPIHLNVSFAFSVVIILCSRVRRVLKKSHIIN